MLHVRVFAVLLSWIFVVFATNAIEDDSKRLLFNDPQSVQTLLAQYESELQNLRQRVDVLEKDNQSKGSSTFVRWGKKTCTTDNNTELVYSGIAGGGGYGYAGSGVDSLCLPHNPDTSNAESLLHSTARSEAGLLYGSEYQMNFNKVYYDDDVPCAVCRVRSQF
uniref:Uncharacterized protein n=1 Tax=Pinctada fucata TaxID=50426 RepID=A0A194ANE5_PINFU